MSEGDASITKFEHGNKYKLEVKHNLHITKEPNDL